jgi:hypothetical protein
MKSYTARGRELQEEYRARRKEQMKRMLEGLRKDKEELIRKRDELKQQYKNLPEGQMKQVTYMKIRKIEQDLETEYYKILDDGTEKDKPSVQKPKAPPVKKYQEEMVAEEKRRKQMQEEMRREREMIEREEEQEAEIRRMERMEY